jgi:hypothetical protein
VPQGGAVLLTPAKTVNRPATTRAAEKPAPVPTPSPASTTGGLRISSPKDPAEREADRIGKKIVQQGTPPSLARFEDSASLLRQRAPASEIQCKLEGPVDNSSNLESEIRVSQSGGSPLPLSVRQYMEPRFGASFKGVRVHTDDKAAKLNRQVSARAFTVGSHVFFGKGRFQPETPEGRELLAHELTHTIQQGGAAQQKPTVHRSVDVTVTQTSAPQIQRLDIVQEGRDYFADKAKNIPGFTMFTVVIGVNPINGASVGNSAEDILGAVIEIMPGGAEIRQALDNHGIVKKAATWISAQIKTLGIVGSSIVQEITAFLKKLSLTDIRRVGQKWEEAKSIVTSRIDQIEKFVTGLVADAVQLIKDAILKPIGKLAEGTPFYDLLKAVIGSDPVTGDAFTPTADNLIGPFMKLIGQDEVYQNMKKANAVARAFAWFKGAMAGIKEFAGKIPGLFVKAFKELKIEDIILLPNAFAKLKSVFGGFVSKFTSWALDAVLKLLEIIFDVVSPGAFGYVKKTGAAFVSILKNPLPFMGNLVKAGMLGFQQFAGRFGAHLKAGLLEWLPDRCPASTSRRHSRWPRSSSSRSRSWA